MYLYGDPWTSTPWWREVPMLALTGRLSISSPTERAIWVTTPVKKKIAPIISVHESAEKGKENQKCSLTKNAHRYYILMHRSGSLRKWEWCHYFSPAGQYAFLSPGESSNNSFLPALDSDLFFLFLPSVHRNANSLTDSHLSFENQMRPKMGKGF